MTPLCHVVSLREIGPRCDELPSSIHSTLTYLKEALDEYGCHVQKQQSDSEYQTNVIAEFPVTISKKIAFLRAMRPMTQSRILPANELVDWPDRVRQRQIRILSISFAEHQQPFPQNQAMSQKGPYGIRDGKWRGSDEKPEYRLVSMSGYDGTRVQQRQH